MHVLDTHHVALLTANFERLRDSYVKTLKLSVIGGFVEDCIVFIAAGGVAIELEQAAEADGSGPLANRGWRHVALEVANVDAVYRELAERGVAFDLPPVNFPEHAPRAGIEFFQDLDGNRLEVIQPLGAHYAPLDLAENRSRD